MHETIFAKQIVDKAKAQGNVKSITVELGELGHVPPSEMLHCLEGMVDWEIVSREKKAKVTCECGFEGPPKILERGHDFFLIECPECGKVPEVLEGTDIKLLSVEVE